MSISKDRFPRLLVAVLAVALALRVLAAFWWQARLPGPRDFAFGDSASYWVLARTIVRGEPYRYGIDQSRVFRAPGYPALLAGLFLVIGDDPPVVWGRLVGAVCGTVAVGAVALLAWQLFDERTAVLAGAVAACYPGGIGMSVFVLSEAPFVPLMLLQVSCWVAADRDDAWAGNLSWSAAAGVLGGFATLVRPSWLLFVPFACVALLLCGCGNRRRWTTIAVTLAATALVMTPWWIRNHAVTGTFVATTLQTGASLYDGWNPEADGGSDMRFVQRFYDEQLQADAASVTAPALPFDVRLDQRMRDAALEWASNHPRRVVQLAAIKLARMWSPWPHAAEFRSVLFRMVVLLGYLPLVCLAIWGAMRFAPRGWPYLLCLLPAIYFSGLHMVFASSIRYRQPPMMALIVLAAAALSHCDWASRLRRETTETHRRGEAPTEADQRTADED